MSARSRIAGLGRRAHGVSRAAGESTAARKMGMGLLGATAIGAGVISGAGEVMDSAFDVAFDDPQADRAFVGGDIGFGTLIGSSIGGFAGSASRAHLYSDASMISGGISGAAMGAAGIGAGALAVGAGYGAQRAGMSKLGKLGMKGGAGIAALGVMAIAGGVSSARSGYQAQSAKQNPFVNTSSGTMNRLNISGDIVLGAHNTRRGY